MVGTDTVPFLDVRISKATNVVWEGKAQSVSSKNAQGAFDILPMHANFVTLIRNEPIVVHHDDVEDTYTFKESVIYVQNNSVKVYADIT
jgi:F0F1-type ATP synthase epsilon subunit